MKNDVLDFCSYWYLKYAQKNRHFITLVILYDVFKTICGTKNHLLDLYTACPQTLNIGYMQSLARLNYF